MVMKFSPPLVAGDDYALTFGGVAKFVWDTTDANANMLKGELPAGGAVDVPVVLLGIGHVGVDLAFFDGNTNTKLALMSNLASAISSDITFIKSRGSASSPTVITTGDDLGRLLFYGHDGTTYTQAGGVIFDSEGTISTGVVPGIIKLNTANASGTVTSAWQVNSAQQTRSLATTDSTSPTTGASLVDGGLGIAKALFVGGTSITLTAGNSTNNSVMKVENTSNAAAASHAYFEAAVGGITSQGDPHIRFTIPSGSSWILGVDNSDQDKFEGSLGTSLGTATWLNVDQRATTVGVTGLFLNPTANYTLSSAANAVITQTSLFQRNVAYTGTTQVTSLLVGVDVPTQTLSGDTATLTVDKATSATLVAPTAGTNITLTMSSALRLRNTAAGAGTTTNQSALFIEAITGGGTNNYQITLANGVTPTTAALANHAHINCVDLSADNASLAFWTEHAEAVSVATASTHKWGVQINGTTYYILLSNV